MWSTMRSSDTFIDFAAPDDMYATVEHSTTERQSECAAHPEAASDLLLDVGQRERDRRHCTEAHIAEAHEHVRRRVVALRRPLQRTA
eukprot:SAG11_NODE_5629_length_1503_cov_1.120370_2_plen_87_part_00